MAAPDLVNLASLIDDATCYVLVRQQRWPDGVRCPACGSAMVIRHGHDDTQEQRQRYRFRNGPLGVKPFTALVHRSPAIWCRFSCFPSAIQLLS